MTTGPLDAATLARFLALPAATIYESQGKLGDMDPAIKPVARGMRLGGPAFTAKCWPGDSKGVLRAIDAAPPGAVLVVDAGATMRSTIWGGTSSMAAKLRGLAGIVTNAAVRDAEELAEIGWPVFAPGCSVRGTVKNHPGWLGLTVSVGDVPVAPGDIIVGDADGVVVVPAARLAEVASRAFAAGEAEAARDARIRAGEPITRVLGITD